MPRSPDSPVLARLALDIQTCNFAENKAFVNGPDTMCRFWNGDTAELVWFGIKTLFLYVNYGSISRKSNRISIRHRFLTGVLFMQAKKTFATLRQNEREARKLLIVDCALTLFEKMQFHEIGMREIAAEAGVSAASIYSYFSSRDDLYVEALNRSIEKIQETVSSRLELEGNTIENIALICIDYLMDNEACFQIMAHFMVKRGIKPETLEKFISLQRYFLGRFDELLAQHGYENEARVASHAFLASLVGVSMTFHNDPVRGREDVRAHMHKLALIITGAFTNENKPLQKK